MGKFSTFAGSRKVKIFLLVFFVLLLGIIFSSCSTIYGLYCRSQIKSGLNTPGTFGKARLEVIQDIPVLHLYGTPEEMGRQYGTLLRKSLSSLNGYLHAFVPAEKIESLISAAKSREKNLPQEAVKELKAISEASGVPYEVLLTFNITPKMACSALAVWGKTTTDGEMILGRNADYYGFGLSDRGSMLIVYHPNEGKKVLSINFIGMIGAFTGINEDGVAFGNMLVFNSSEPEFNEDGVTIQLLLRQAAHKSSNVGEFGRYLIDQKHLISMNVMVADTKNAKILELGTVRSKEKNPVGDFLAVSNYFIDPDMGSGGFKCPRYDSLMRSVEENSGKYNEKIMENALRDAIIEGLNLQAVVFQPSKMVMHISVNKIPAAEGPYREFNLKELFKD